MSTHEGGRVAILGVGDALPALVRTNDDPIFDTLRASSPLGKDLFQGYRERRVLEPGESLAGLMVSAAQRALEDARVAVDEVDVLLGSASMGPYLAPNGLAEVHRDLGLPKRAPVLAVGSEHATFGASLLLGHAMVEAGLARRAVVVCGASWTRHVRYDTPQAASASDGAGAVVLGRTPDPSRFRVVDHEVEVRSREYGAMYLQGDRLADGAFSEPYFHVTEAGARSFLSFGAEVPPAAVLRLLARHELRGEDVTLVTHQSSSVLMDRWRAAIRPGQYVDTLPSLGNLVLASVPVNLSRHYGEIEKDHLVLVGLGVEMQVIAVLLERDGRAVA